MNANKIYLKVVFVFRLDIGGVLINWLWFATQSGKICDWCCIRTAMTYIFVGLNSSGVGMSITTSSPLFVHLSNVLSVLLFVFNKGVEHFIGVFNCVNLFWRMAKCIPVHLLTLEIVIGVRVALIILSFYVYSSMYFV